MKLNNFYLDIPVLTYHKISDEKEIGLTTVTLNEFDKQLSYLKREGYSSFLPKNYSKEIPKKAIIISFDDAYESVYKNALPIMIKYGFQGIVFVISDYIGKLNTWDANLNGKTFCHTNTDQINSLLGLGWEIGAHTKSHKSFLKKQNYESEILGSISDLENQFNTKITSFSYPFGTSNKPSINILNTHNLLGFKATPQNSSKEKIGRCSVYSTDSIKDLKNKINLTIKETTTLKLINFGAKATEIGQLLNIINGDK